MRFILLEKDKKYDVNSDEDIVLVGLSTSSSSINVNVNSSASVNVYGVFVLSNGNTVNLKTLSNHTLQNAKSRTLIKTILSGDSQFNYEGMIHIGKYASGTDAYLQNENLILSDNAIINSTPQLEIENNSVKASHGVVTSTINSVHLEYLMSRGLPKHDSIQLIVTGFVGDIAKMLPADLYEKLQKRLSDIFK